MDFKFTNLGKNKLILISGATSNEHNQIKKLEGPPLLLKGRYTRPLTENERSQAVLQMVRLFWKKKVEYLYAVLAQWYDSIHANLNTLTYSTIHHYIQGTTPREKIIILWNGHTNNEILEHFEINSYGIGNMTCCSYKNNNEFYLKLINFRTKQEICSHYVGNINKIGHQLNLVETHTIYVTRNKVLLNLTIHVMT